MSKQGGGKPPLFKISRDYVIQSTEVEANLFISIQQNKLDVFNMGAVQKRLSRRDALCYVYALEQILYSQSVQSGAALNTGTRCIPSNATKQQRQTMDTDTEHSLTKKSNRLADVGIDAECGAVKATLNELCRVAYGVENPTTEQKERMKAIIYAVDNTQVGIVYKKDNEEVLMRVKLATLWFERDTEPIKSREDYYNRMRNNRFDDVNAPIEYYIEINPIFCNMKQGYGLLPIDAMSRLTDITKQQGKRKTYGHIKLMTYFAIQKTDAVLTRTEDELLRQMGVDLAECKKNNHLPRAKQELCDTLQMLVDIGQLVKLPIATTDKTGTTTYKITINPNFTKKIQG